MFLVERNIEDCLCEEDNLLWVVLVVAVVAFVVDDYDCNFEEYLQMLAFLSDMVLDFELIVARRFIR